MSVTAVDFGKRLDENHLEDDHLEELVMIWEQELDEMGIHADTEALKAHLSHAPSQECPTYDFLNGVISERMRVASLSFLN